MSDEIEERTKTLRDIEEKIQLQKKMTKDDNTRMKLQTEYEEMNKKHKELVE